MNQAPHQLLKTSPSMKIGLTLLSCLATTLAFNINYEDLERTAQVIPEPELEEGIDPLFNPQFNFTGRYSCFAFEVEVFEGTTPQESCSTMYM